MSPTTLLIHVDSNETNDAVSLLLLFAKRTPSEVIESTMADIHDAAREGDLNKVQQLVEREFVSVNAKDNTGETPLHWASRKGHMSVVKYLLGKGADIHVKNNHGNIPLHCTSWYGHLPVVKFLVRKGADIHAQNKYGSTPLHIACPNGHTAVVKFLVRKGADIHAQDDEGSTPLHLAC